MSCQSFKGVSADFSSLSRCAIPDSPMKRVKLFTFVPGMPCHRWLATRNSV
jgi:hypothetical protein